MSLPQNQGFFRVSATESSWVWYRMDHLAPSCPHWGFFHVPFFPAPITEL